MTDPGYVYILTNPSFREDWVKIGKSSRPVDIRSKELDNTAVPLPFEIYATLKTAKYEIVEKKIHKAIDRLTTLRIRRNREFFNIEPAKALEILRDEAEVLEDAEIVLYKDNKPIMETPAAQPEKPRPEKVEKKKPAKISPSADMKGLCVLLPDGTFIHEKVAADTFAKAVTAAGLDRVKALGIIFSHAPLVSDTIDEKYKSAQKEVAPGVYVMTHSNNKDKCRMLERISTALNLGWKVKVL